MDLAMKIRNLREETGMTRKEYIPRLIAYQLMYEGLLKRIR